VILKVLGEEHPDPVARHLLTAALKEARPDLAKNASNNISNALSRLRDAGKIDGQNDAWQLVDGAAAASKHAGSTAPRPPRASSKAKASAPPDRAVVAMAVEVEGSTSVSVQLTPRMRARLEAFIAVAPRGMSIERAVQLFLEAAFAQDAA